MLTPEPQMVLFLLSNGVVLGVVSVGPDARGSARLCQLCFLQLARLREFLSRVTYKHTGESEERLLFYMTSRVRFR